MKEHHSRIRVAVLYGGRSAEHEISVITALQAMKAIDTSLYQIIPVYVGLNGKWYTGDPLLRKSFYRRIDEALLQEVTFLPNPQMKGLVPLSNQKIHLQALIPIDVCLMAFHGQFGEDGCVQGLLELADIPYTGCGVLASAMAMHKHHCKIFLQSHGIPVLPSIVIKREEAMKDLQAVYQRIYQTAGLEKFPLFVKPCHLGSSIGISRTENEMELGAALAKAFRYDDEALVEPCIHELMELNVAVLEGDPPIASVVEIPLSSAGATLTYEEKYLRGGKKGRRRVAEGMASLTRLINPSHVDGDLKQEAIHYALKGFALLNAGGVARFDFIFDKSHQKLYFNELNPIPGSLAFYLWEKSEPYWLYTDMIHYLIQRAQQRHTKKLSLQTQLEFKALLKD